MFFRQFYDPSTAEYLDPKTERKTVFITGANTGIGWFTALHLYLHGYIVYIGGRTETKVTTAIEEIKKEAEKRTSKYTEEERRKKPFGSLHFIYIDLLDLSTVEKAAKEYGSKETSLDILINNAGLLGVPYSLSKDGYEGHFQVNYLATALATLEFLPYLQKTSLPRVLFLSSLAHMSRRSYVPNSDQMEKGRSFTAALARYARAKLSVIQFAVKLAEQHSNILVGSIHPGLIHSDLYRHWTKDDLMGTAVKMGIAGSFWLFGISTEQGALGTLRVALDPTLTAEKDSGKYYVEGGKESSSSALSKDKQYVQQTWDWTLQELSEKGYKFTS